jgi:carnitine O-acetyltransferase
MRRHSAHSNGPQGKEIPVRMAPARKESEITLGTTLEQVAADAESANTEEQDEDYNNYYPHSQQQPHPHQQQQELHQPPPTFAFQDSLPRLPIPTLDETLNKFLRHVEALLPEPLSLVPPPPPPLLMTSASAATVKSGGGRGISISSGSGSGSSSKSNTQHRQQVYKNQLHQLQQQNPEFDAQQVVLDFLKGDGPRLQELLLDYEQAGLSTGLIGSYVEEFWNESNLAPDPSVVLNLNPYFVLEDGPDPKMNKDPLRRAASLCFACIKMASQLRHEQLLPDVFKGQPLCMDQFKAIFGAARVPHPPDDAFEGGADDIDIYPDSGHVVVMCRNQLYYFQCLWWDGSVAVDEEDVLDILEAIQKNAKQYTPEEAATTALGILTSLDRKTWGKVRFELSQIAMNNEYLIIIDSSLFVLVLDEYIPTSSHDAAANMLHGSYQMKPLSPLSTTIRTTTTPTMSPGKSRYGGSTSYNGNGSNASGSTTTRKPRHNLRNKHNSSSPPGKDKNKNNNIATAATNNDHDTHKSTTTDGEGPLYQVGSCCNRWYDKFQIIVCGDGTAGINFEHSAIDGHTALRIVSDIYAETVVNFAQSITKTIQAHQRLNPHHPLFHHHQQQEQQQRQETPYHNSRSEGMMSSNGVTMMDGGSSGADRNAWITSIPNVVHAKVLRAATIVDEHGRPALDVLPKRMQFTIPANIKRQIFHAEAALGDKIVASETVVLEFNDYGKLLITGNHLSPDAYIQMSILLAYYKLYGKVVCSYEPVLTKSFFHGRTEAMRSTTREAKDLCEAFFQTRYSTVQKLSMLRRAIQTQVQYVSECARGKGVDRHLHALKCIAERHEIPMPPFFESKPWKLLNHSILSTSNCGNPSIRLFGFGPVVSDGFGIGYIIKDKSVCYTISSKHRQTKRFVFALEGVLKSMAKLLKRNTLNVPPMGQPGGRRVSLKKMPAIHSMGQEQPRQSSFQSTMPKAQSSPRSMMQNADPSATAVQMPRRSSSHASGIGVMSDMWGESDSGIQAAELPSDGTYQHHVSTGSIPSPPKPNQKNDRWSDLGMISSHAKKPLYPDVSSSSLSGVSMSTAGTGAFTSQQRHSSSGSAAAAAIPGGSGGILTSSLHVASSGGGGGPASFTSSVPPTPTLVPTSGLTPSPASDLSDHLPQRPNRRASHFVGQKRIDTMSMRSLYESGMSLDFGDISDQEEEEDDDGDDDDADDVSSTEADSDNLLGHKFGESVGVIGECSIDTFDE